MSIQKVNSPSFGGIRKVVSLRGSLLYREDIGFVTKRQEKDLADKGLKLSSDYKHSIENTAIIHNQKKHGSELTEAPRGQIAITEKDYELIPDILENYDCIEVELGLNRLGLQTIKYTKVYKDGTTYYLEEVRTGRKSLAFKTMYKQKRKVIPAS